MRWFQALFLFLTAGLIAASGCAGQEFASTSDPVAGTGTSMPAGDQDGGVIVGAAPPAPDCVPARRCANDPTHTDGQALDCGSAPNGCGDTLQCGACPSGEKCQSGKCMKQAFCGSGTCDTAAGETCESCPGDCPCASGKCIDAMCCMPDCSGKTCGDDGCGGVCGDPAGCGNGFICDKGACKQMASCGNSTCEPMLMEDCNTCPLDCKCNGGKCYNSMCCTPNCTGKTCGSDGCGGTCGTAPCASGSSCVMGNCKADIVCGKNGCQAGEDCSNCASDCACTTTQKCTTAGMCCDPQCSGKECGDDKCGSTCGTCATGKTCNAMGKCDLIVQCGINGCQAGENCGNCGGPPNGSDCACSAGQVCSNSQCCTKQCSGKQCGSDGCGGNCGVCATGQSCNANGQCMANVSCGDGTCQTSENCSTCPQDCMCNGICQAGGVCCIPNCGGATCGNNNCGQSCGTCASGFPCQGGQCKPQCGDGMCVTGENCGNCPQDCTPCPNGYETCFNNQCCHVPVCNVDWTCGSGTVCGVAVDCGTTSCTDVGQTCNQVTHSCEDICAVQPVSDPNIIPISSNGNGGNSNQLPQTSGASGFSGDIIAGHAGTICAQ